MFKGGVRLKNADTTQDRLKINGLALSDQQAEIIKHDGNIIVSASAGTGKTHTMVSKIVCDLEKNKTHKVIAAITFTIKAAQEIRDRIKVDVDQNFIGTNNSFAIEEIIKPFMKDVYGEDYDKDFDTDYDGKRDFCMESGIAYMRKEETIGKCCKDNSCEMHPKKNENFIFKLALRIVKESLACRIFLKAKYFGIYIDEYQDCDGDMHALFMHLCNNLGIRTFVVGDVKQSIYRWRGANPDLFIEITKNDRFKHFNLTKNHRSCKNIQNYSNLLFQKTAYLYEKSTNENEIVVVRQDISNWADKVGELIDVEKSSVLLRKYDSTPYFGKDSSLTGSKKLVEHGIDSVYIPVAPIESITTKTAWLYMAVARYLLLENFTVFDFINEVPAEGNVGTKKIQEIKQHLDIIKNHCNDEEKLARKFGKISEFFNCTSQDVNKSNINKLFKTVNDDQYIISLNMYLPLHCAMTIHKSKGLEFDQAIIFLEDYGHNGRVENSDINNHYVACTRARSKLIIVDTLNNDACAMKKKLKELFYQVDYTDFISCAT